MDGRVQPVFLGHTEAFTLNAKHDAIASELKIVIVRLLLVFMDGLSDGRVNEVLDLGTCETGSELSQRLRNDGLIFLDLFQVQIENVLTTIDVRPGHMDDLIETAWPDRSRIEGILVIRGSNHHDVLVLLEAIHLS